MFNNNQLTIEQELEALERSEKEAKELFDKKRKELLEKKAKAEALAKQSVDLIEFTFQHQNNTFFYKFNKFETGLVEDLKKLPSHNWDRYALVNKTNYLDYRAFKKIIDKHILILNDNIISKLKQLESWLDTPDLEISMSDASTVKIEKHKIEYLILYLDSIRGGDTPGNFAYLSLHELWRLPSAIETYYKNKVVLWHEDVKQALANQVARRDSIESIANAEDAEWNVKTQDYEEPEVPKPMRNFQKVACKFQQIAGGSAIIAYDKGLGKTRIGYEISETDNLKTLILCPTHLTENWLREGRKWTNKPVRLLTGIIPDADQIQDIIVNKFNYQYYVIGFAIIGRTIKDKTPIDDEKGLDNLDNESAKIMPWVTMLSNAGFGRIIIDEAHNMRNMGSGKSIGGRTLAKTIPNRINLTGGPVVNKPGDLWPLLNVVDEVAFQSDYAFNRDFVDPQDKRKVRNVTKLHETIKPYLIRRTKEQVIKNLPPIERYPINHELSPKAKSAYDEVMQGIYTDLLKPDVKINVSNFLSELMRLKQICAQDKLRTSVLSAIDAYEETEHKVLIYSQFLPPIHEMVNKLNLEFPKSTIWITGEQNLEEKYKMVDKFQKDESIKFMCCSIRAASEGLALTKAHTIIFNDLEWGHEPHLQAEARAWGRLNDLHGAQSHYVLASGTIDEFLMTLIKRKLTSANLMIDKLRSDEDIDENVIVALLNHIRGR